MFNQFNGVYKAVKDQYVFVVECDADPGPLQVFFAVLSCDHVYCKKDFRSLSETS